jgi:queuine tRNA-ribosyltransferase
MEDNKFAYKLIAKDNGTRARRGEISTPHGTIQTPAFMPVGTYGSVKAVSADDLEELGFDIILGNTYHLYLRPGDELISDCGGLHRFTGWRRPILTDSGGFQIFSLKALVKITDEGVLFKSHIDGSSHMFTPQRVIDIQRNLGADIIMPLDICLEYPASKAEAYQALLKTDTWERTAKDYWQSNQNGQALFGIIQGSVYPELRRLATEKIMEVGFPGYALGGLSVGEPLNLMYEITEAVTELLPEDKPRYLMGLGSPLELLEAVARGIDMFDCVMPTRNARNGTIFTRHGRMTLKAASYSQDFRPIDEDCGCPVCRRYNRAYLRHLFNVGEPSVLRLATLHNLFFISELMAGARTAIMAGNYSAYLELFKQSYVKD